MASNKRDLSKFFNARSIAIVGVPREATGFGGGSFLDKFLECKFPGKLYPINPKADEIQGLKAYPNLSSLPETPDLVVIAVVARLVPRVLEECAHVGARHIHILTSGFSELGTEEGNDLENQITSISEKNGLLIIGPNCMGPYCPASKITSWGAIPGMPGPVGVISQSGTITQRLTEYLYYLGVGVEKAVSMGNATVLGAPDYLEFMADDDQIKAIAMYIESVKDGRRFLNLAREVCKRKPIIIWKGGESDAGARTVTSHTGSMAGENRIWEAFFWQTSAIHARSMNEWADATLGMALLPPATGKEVFLIGGGGGTSVGNSDVCIREGLSVPRLSEKTMNKLRETVPVAGSIAGNPLDEWRTYDDPDYLKEILELGYADPNISTVIVDRLIPRKAFHMEERENTIPALVDFVKRKQGERLTVFTVDSEGGDVELSAKGTTLRAELCKAGLPAYPSMKRAAWALAQHYRYYSRLTTLGR